jgi:hypothetical protein
MVSGSSAACCGSTRVSAKEMPSNDPDMLSRVRNIVQAASLPLPSQTRNPVSFRSVCIDSVLNTGHWGLQIA